MARRTLPRYAQRGAQSHQATHGFSEKERQEAWDAIQVMRTMMPQMRHFARSVTGNPKMDVDITHDTPHSTRNKIFIRPPLALGKKQAHYRSDCQRRGPDGKQLCKACQVREVIDFFLYHEINHVVFESHTAINDDDVQLAFAYLNEWHPASACKHGADIRMAIAQTHDVQVIGIANVLNMYLSYIVNALEDARVNEQMFRQRPGLRAVFSRNIERVMTEGIEITSTDNATWDAAPKDMQFIIGLYLIAAGEPINGRLHEGVIEALNDDTIRHLTEAVVGSTSVHDVFRLSLEIFRYAQTIGFCVVEVCKADEATSEESDPGDPGTGSADDGDSGDGSEHSGADDADSHDDSGSQSSSDSTQQQPVSPGSAAGETDGGTGDSKEEGELDDDQRQPGMGGSPGSESPQPEESEGESSDLSGDGESSDSDDTSGSEDDGQDDPLSETSSDETERTGSEGAGQKPGDDGGSTDGLEPQQDDDLRPPVRSGGSGEGSDSGSVQSESNDDDSGDDADGDASQSSPAARRGGEDPDGLEDSTEQPEAEDDLTDPADVWNDGQADQEGGHAPEHGVDYGDALDGLGETLADDLARMVSRFLMHGVDGQQGMLDDMADGDIAEMVGIEEEGELDSSTREVIRVANQQVQFFDAASREVAGVEIPTFPEKKLNWTVDYAEQEFRKTGNEIHLQFKPDEGLIGKATTQLRVALDENRKARYVPNLKSGRINTRALGRRAPVGDDRIFSKKQKPKDRDYSVLIGLDGSGSTDSFDRNAKIKRMAYAQADMLSRLGIPFAIYTHTATRAPLANLSSFYENGNYYLYILPIKEVNEPWNDLTKMRLACMGPMAENLDGHTLEFYRKELMRRQATDRILIYVTDGQMPASNYDEELEVLEREIETCNKQNVHLLGVGINTDSPKNYGMDTVRVDSDQDILKVIEQLARRLK
jgi:hypothetical protein